GGKLIDHLPGPFISIGLPGFTPAAFTGLFDTGVGWGRRHTTLIFTAQPPPAQRAPGYDAHAFCLAYGLEFPFEGTIQQVIQRLQAGERFPTMSPAEVN